MIWLFTLISFAFGMAQGGEEPAPFGVLATPATSQTYVAEPQIPSGKFTTAAEVKPILTATKGNWVAVREYEGRDLVYFSHLLAWRCGLVGFRYGLNGGAMVDYPMPPCLIDTAVPNALTGDHLPFIYQGLKSVETLEVELIYDDLSRDTASFTRNSVLIP